jgi:hypothetical protein
MRTIVIGDVHGCLHEMQDLVRLVKYRPGQDELVFVGDLVDRGPFPRECVQEAMRLGARVTKGNHERKMVEWLEKEARASAGGPANGMRPPNPRRMVEWKSFSQEELRWLDECPSWMNLGKNWLVVHAGFEPLKPLGEQDPETVTMIRWAHETTGNFVGMKKVPVPGSEAPAKPHVSGTRPYDEAAAAKRAARQAARLAKGLPAVAEQKRRPRKFTTSYEQPDNTKRWQEMWRGPQSVVHGHIAQKGEVRIDERDGVRVLGIDTACVYGFKLTAAIFADGEFREFAQVDAREEYYQWPQDNSGD